MTLTISANKYLHYVNICKNKFCNQSVKLFLKAMASINSLQHIELSSYSITDELAIDLEHLARNNSCLEDIIVLNYIISDVKVELLNKSISKIVVKGMLSMNNQVLDENQLLKSSVHALLIVKILPEYFSHLYLRNNIFCDSVVTNLCRSLPEIIKLECFEIAYCGLNETNLFNVILALSKLHNITDLNFSGICLLSKILKYFNLL